jgi:hypothetical protein
MFRFFFNRTTPVVFACSGGFVLGCFPCLGFAEFAGYVCTSLEAAVWVLVRWGASNAVN